MLDAIPPRLRAPLAALFGGLAVIAAFPTVGWVLPVLVAWPPLLALAPKLSWRRRLLAGWLLGFTYQIVIFRWIVFTLQVMTDLPAFAQWIALFAFALWHGLLGGVFLALAEPVREAAARRWAPAAPIAVAALYAALEWLWPFVFPWTLGHAFWRIGPVASVMALTGAPGLSFVVIALGAAAVDLAAGRGKRAALPAVALSAGLLLFGVLWYAHIHATEPRRVLRVAVLQTNYTLEEKRLGTVAVRARLLERLDAQLRALKPGRYDLVVGPEGGMPVAWQVDPRALASGARDRATVATRRVQQALVAGPATDLIMGGLRFPPGERTHNAAVHLAPDGRVLGYYDKRILVPFGEYLPGSELFPDLAGSVKGIGDFGRGDRPCSFDVDGEPVACGICYESIFADYIRETAGDARLLLNFTIDTWFGDSTAPWFHLMVQSSRAVELGVPLIRAALTGISALVGADGVPYRTLGLHETGVLEGEVALRDLHTPYRAVGPVFRWLCLLAALAALVAALVAFRAASRARRELSSASSV